MTITRQQLAAMIPTNPEVDAWLFVLNAQLPKYDIVTPPRIAGFISQCAHESTDFRVLEENLNYSADRLLRVFPRYFGPGRENAADYAHQPEKLANYVYMDKNRSPSGALGNVKDGDGWLFRGRGLKQVTGRNNYTEFAKAYGLGMTAEQAANFLGTKEGALLSALWFWKRRNLNAIADVQDVARLTVAINGGLIGLDNRKARYDRALQVLRSGPQPQASGPASRV